MSQKGYLLDTDTLSDAVKNPQGKVVRKIREAGNESIFTSIIVASELRFGIKKRGADSLTTRVELMLKAINILNFKPPADVHYAHIRNYLEKAGKPIGPNDLLVAAHALTEDLIVVTGNTREFCRVPDLEVENWLL